MGLSAIVVSGCWQSFNGWPVSLHPGKVITVSVCLSGHGHHMSVRARSSPCLSVGDKVTTVSVCLCPGRSSPCLCVCPGRPCLSVRPGEAVSVCLPREAVFLPAQGSHVCLHREAVSVCPGRPYLPAC